MRTWRFFAVVFGLIMLSSVCFDLASANETDFILKYSWPSLDVEMLPSSAPQPQVGVFGFELSINMWEDRLGMLSTFEMGEFELHGIGGEHIINPGTAAERIYEYETDNKVTKGIYSFDMRVFLGNFFRRWSEAELKVMRDLNLALVLGWNWQHYKFDRDISEISIAGHPDEDVHPELLPWSSESGFDKDHGGAYKLRTTGFEFGLSADWTPFTKTEVEALKQISVHFLGRYSPILRVEYCGVQWTDRLEDVYGADCEGYITYDFAKLLDLKNKQRLTAGIGYNFRILNGSDFNAITTHGAVLTIGYGLPHDW
ncbi:MAG: hypothetical protein JW941_09300 [Candidatus Coatesbacteria bacterium]|nr:hypothetical protein [Candidatus Coatesbacteria bacterium]